MSLMSKCAQFAHKLHSSYILLLSPKGQIPKLVMTMSDSRPSAWRPWQTCSLCRISTPRPWRGVRRLWRKPTSTSEYCSLFWMSVAFFLLSERLRQRKQTFWIFVADVIMLEWFPGFVMTVMWLNTWVDYQIKSIHLYDLDFFLNREKGRNTEQCIRCCFTLLDRLF